MLTHVSAPDAEGKVTYIFNAQSKVEVPRRYEVQSLVGRGAYGIVCSAVDSTTGDTVAIKKISNIFDDLIDGKRILREVKLLGFLKHPNVLSLKDLFRPSDPNFTDLYVVTELMSSDLQYILKSSAVQLTDVHCQYFTYQLLCALHYIHSANVIHRDLKPANILTNAECDLKLCDFGLARGIGNKMTHYVVTRWYRPPELLLASDNYNTSVDLWGVACLAAEMITTRPLFPGRDYIHQLNLIISLLGTPDMTRELPEVRAAEAIHYMNSLPSKCIQNIDEIHPQLKQDYIAAAARHARDDEDGEENNNNSNNNNSNNNNSEEDITAQHIKAGEARYELFKDFLMKLLKYNPKERLTAREAMLHPWLAEVRENCGGEAFEVEAGETFFWEFDGAELSAGQLRQLLQNEITKYTE